MTNEFEHLEGTEFEVQAVKVAEIRKGFTHTVGYKTNADKMYAIFSALNDALGREKAKDARIEENDKRIANFYKALVEINSLEGRDVYCEFENAQVKANNALVHDDGILSGEEDTNDRA